MPNGAARALSSRRSRAIGAVVPTVENTGFATAVAAVQQRLEEHGYTLLLASSQYDPAAELRAVKMLLSHGIDGIMLVGGEHHKDLAPLLDRYAGELTRNVTFLAPVQQPDRALSATAHSERRNGGLRAAVLLLPQPQTVRVLWTLPLRASTIACRLETARWRQQ